MQTQDDERWSQQVADLHADGEAGQRFLDFFTFWFDTAGVLLTEGRGGFRDDSTNMPVIEAVRMALEMAEQQFGFLSVELIGQMLTVATMHWEYGAAMAEQLTFIERRVMQQALADKIADLQNSAANGINTL